MVPTRINSTPQSGKTIIQQESSQGYRKAQTSSLEAFHSLIFPFIGMLCRLYLAAMHFNEKSKKGECTAKPVKIEPTYNHVDDLMSLLLHKVFVDPTPYTEELHSIPIPPPLSSQFEKPSKEEVIAHRVSRFSRGVAGTQHAVQLDQETVGGSGQQHMTG